MFTSVVLGSLLMKDRAWAVEALMLATGDCIGTLAAIAQLDRAGLVNQINKQLVCASRAAQRGDQIELGV